MAELDWRDWTPRLARYYEALLRSQGGRAAAHLHNLRKALRYGLTADLGSFTDDPQELVDSDRIVLKLEMESTGESEELDLKLAALEEEGAANDLESEIDGSPGVAQEPDPQAAATLRRIARKQRSDPHNRETLLGFPLIAVKVGRSSLSGPLLVWEVAVDYEPRHRELRLDRNSPIPNLNNVLLGKLAEDPDDIALVNEKLMPLLYGGDFHPGRIPEFLDVITGIFDPLRKYRELPPDESSLRKFLSEVVSLSSGDPARVSMRPVLANGPRSHAFLLSDLEEIASQGHPEGDSVLSQIVGDVPEEGAPDRDPIRLPFEDTADGGRPLWFPFPSNRSQRQVAQTASAVKVLTVQGPPGTGKSQTIANLVCHLVTEGHSVLVTSHQKKAMEVLSNMLRDFGGLALPMLSGDKESLERLRTQLEGVQDRPPDDLTPDSIERGEAALLEMDRELRRLARRFRELRRIEHDEFSKFAHYEDIRDHDKLSPDDDPVEEEVSRTAERLQEWARLFHSLRAGLGAFEAVFRPEGRGTPRVVEGDVARTLDKLISAAESLDRPVSSDGRAVAQRLLQAGQELDGLPDLLARLVAWISSEASDVERNLRDLGQHPEREDVLGRWMTAVSRIRKDRIQSWATRVDQLLAGFERSPLRGGEYDWEHVDEEAHSIRQDVRVLAQRGSSFFWWYLVPDAYRTRRRLREHGFEVRRSALTADLSHIRNVLKWNERWHESARRCADVSEQIAMHQPVAIRSRSKEEVVRTLSLTRSAILVLQQVETIPEAELRLAFGQDVALHRLCTQPGRDELLEQLDDARRWVVRRQLTGGLLDALSLPSRWARRVEAVAEAIEEGRLTERAEDALDRLTRLQRNYPFFRRMLDLESVELARFPHSLDDLRAEISSSGNVPEWITKAESALEAHRLSALARASLSVHPDDLSEISDALEVRQTERRRRLSELIRRKRRLAVYEALRKPATRFPLLELRKLLDRKRLNESLLALRDRIDYRAVLEVFPCWICTIDDATRLFPPKAGLFDYLIVDEASQCGQPTALPLAFRSKRMIVVGDKKQLQPVTSMFLSGKTVRLLQEEHGIHAHPKASFLDGKESLLDLAEACSNASLFLDEHFRCDPAIIRWSNNRFYDNRLQILTRRKPDRARLPLEVRELVDADETEDKVNRKEADAVVREIRRLTSSDDADGKTIGAISLFRAQAELIELLIHREFRDKPELIKRHEIVASTADGFQGDERHIILYSFRQGPSSHPGSIPTIQRSEERLNVAFTRAKDRGICFISLPVNEFPNGAVRDFLEHAKQEQNRAEAWSVEGNWPDTFDSQFEESVCYRLRDQDLRVTTQVPCGRYLIDLVVEDEEGRQLAVECDGEWKMDALGQLRPRDYQRQDIIERAGWPVHRISGRRWLLNPEREIEKLMDALRRQPTRRVMRELRGVEELPVEGETVDSEVRAGEPEAAEDRPPEEQHTSRRPPEHTRDAAKEDDPTQLADCVHDLGRWVVLRPSPEWSIFERLAEVEKLLRRGIGLPAEQKKFLKQAAEWAGALGFAPEKDCDDRLVS